MSSGSSPASEARHAVAAWSEEDVHEQVAARIPDLPPGVVLDVGCGDGVLGAVLAARAGDGSSRPGRDRHRWLGLDRSRAAVERAPGPVVVADAGQLPVRTRSVAAVAALWVLYELDDPAAAIAEAARVLVPGGAFYACSTRRDDAPELAEHFENPATTFDAEEAPALVSASFAEVETRSWDEPLVHLPDRVAVVTYLRGRGAPSASAEAAAAELAAPLSITKRGSLVIGRRPR